MKYLNIFCIAIAFTLASIPAEARDPSSSNSQAFDQLVEWMQGSFTSLNQAKADTNYINVHLNVVRIWHDDAEGAWFYAEHAAAFAPNRPYLQRIIQIVPQADHSFKYVLYKLPDPKAYIGAFRNRNQFYQLNKSDLVQMPGCEIDLEFADGKFSGAIAPKTCPTEYRGAAYTTSSISISENSIQSLSQGWNEAGEQVWGPESGGYLFDRWRATAGS